MQELSAARFGLCLLFSISGFCIIEPPWSDSKFGQPVFVGYCVFLAVSHYLCHFFACHHNSMDFYAKIGQRDQDSMTGFTGGLRLNELCMFSFNIVPYTIRPPLGARKPGQTGNLPRHFHAIRPDKNKKILPPERKAGIFFQYQARRPSGRLVTATGGSCGPRHLGQHGAGLLAGAGVDVVVAEENLRR